MIDDFSNRLLVGMTAPKGKNWEEKLAGIKKHKINRFALFLSETDLTERKKIYAALTGSKFDIPLVHIRHDMVAQELEFLKKEFKSKYLTIHGDAFPDTIRNWRGYYKDLYLELYIGPSLPQSADVSKIGGFCIDLSHFKGSEEKQTPEFEYVMKRKNTKRYFACNHLNGYSYQHQCDLHTITSLKDFDYLKTVPQFIFGEVIALEMYNSIDEQLEFKKYLVNMLSKR